MKKLLICFLLLITSISCFSQGYKFKYIREGKMSKDGQQVVGDYNDYEAKSIISIDGVDIKVEIDGVVFLIGRKKNGAEEAKEETSEAVTSRNYYFPLGNQFDKAGNFYVIKQYNKLTAETTFLFTFDTKMLIFANRFGLK
jgi:hypothetical protein